MPTITERVASILDAPTNSILIHACNAKGSWGSGVAAALKSSYPAAYTIYNTHCHPLTANSNCGLRAQQQSLLGTTLLIPPSGAPSEKAKKHWIACLFTSHGFGRGVAKPAEILQNTRNAMRDLEKQVGVLRGKEGVVVGECWAVRINSGRFGVPWAKSKEVLEEAGLDVVVVRREEDDEAEAEGEKEKEREEGGNGGEKRKRDTGGRGGKADRGSKRGRAGREMIDGWLK